MDIVFAKAKLERVFNSNSLLQREYGKEQAGIIQLRMSVLRAAPTLLHVPILKPDRRHQLEGNRIGQFAVDLKHPFRILFEPNHDPIPKKSDGGFDLDRITAIKIIGVEDYHK
ncbi:MAG: killer suppression protein [Spirochaetes bacterium]|nr:killer suppression protein [Spirochaetota bacterium]